MAKDEYDILMQKGKGVKTPDAIARKNHKINHPNAKQDLNRH
jgi:hypothetical protein